jgi:hypothetical protein
VQRSRPPVPHTRTPALQIKVYLPIQPTSGKSNGEAPQSSNLSRPCPLSCMGHIDIIPTSMYCRTIIQDLLSMHGIGMHTLVQIMFVILAWLAMAHIL